MEWLLLGNGLMLDLGYVSSLVQDVVVAATCCQLMQEAEQGMWLTVGTAAS